MRGCWGIIAVTAVTTSLVCLPILSYAQNKTSKQAADITGAWVLDKAYARTYFTEGAKLQQRWCGVSWPDAEVERRIQAMEHTNDIISQITLKKINENTYENVTVNDTDPPKAKRLSDCKIVSGRTECDTGDHQFAQKGYPDLDKSYFRIEGQYMFIDIPMHKSAMNCAKAKEPPDQLSWTSLRYKRK